MATNMETSRWPGSSTRLSDPAQATAWTWGAPMRLRTPAAAD